VARFCEFEAGIVDVEVVDDEGMISMGTEDGARVGVAALGGLGAGMMGVKAVGGEGRRGVLAGDEIMARPALEGFVDGVVVGLEDKGAGVEGSGADGVAVSGVGLGAGACPTAPANVVPIAVGCIAGVELGGEAGCILASPNRSNSCSCAS
jgi:hypothetical protein